MEPCTPLAPFLLLGVESGAAAEEAASVRDSHSDNEKDNVLDEYKHLFNGPQPLITMDPQVHQRLCPRRIGYDFALTVHAHLLLEPVPYPHEGQYQMKRWLTPLSLSGAPSKLNQHCSSGVH